MKRILAIKRPGFSLQPGKELQQRLTQLSGVGLEFLETTDIQEIRESGQKVWVKLSLLLVIPAKTFRV